MSTVIISASASLQTAIQKWVAFWQNQGHEVIDTPKSIALEDILKKYPEIHTGFYRNIERAEILFVANEEKNKIPGYIGSSVFAEITYAVIRKLLHHQTITIILAHPPSPTLPCFSELSLWITLGYITIDDTKRE